MEITLGEATKLLDNIMVNYSQWHTERSTSKKVHAIEEINVLSGKMDELDINEENRIVYYNNALGLDKKYVIISVHGDLLENLSNEDQQELIDDYYSYVKKCYQDYIDEFYGGNEEKLDDDILLGKFDTSCFQKEIKKEYAKRILNKLKG